MPSGVFKLSCYALVRNRAGAILLLQRPAGKGHFPGRWELPGGKLDAGETVEQAVCREVWEEAGLRFAPTALAGAADFPIKDFRVIMLVMACVCESEQVTLSPEHQNYRWVPLDEALEMDLTDPLRQVLHEYSVRRPTAKN